MTDRIEELVHRYPVISDRRADPWARFRYISPEQRPNINGPLQVDMRTTRSIIGERIRSNRGKK